jgi:hypothetical protein
MIKFHCDFCENEMKHTGNYRVTTHKNTYRQRHPKAPKYMPGEDKKYNLCPDCYEAIVIFIGRRKEMATT